jgi:uncharacterized protein (TIGR03790 family)
LEQFSKLNQLVNIRLLWNVALKVIFFVALIGIAKSAFSANNNAGVTPENLAVVVNVEDRNSMEVGQYYLTARHIPQINLVKVSITPGESNLSPAAFETLRQTIFSQLKPNIQAIVMVWTTPYAVSCNSITSAITLGYDAKQCENTCAQGKLNSYFDSPSRAPFDDFG